MTNEEIHWIAGLYEGEGCLHFNKSNNNWTISLTSTDKDVVEKVLLTTKIGAMYTSAPRREGWKTAYKWHVGRQQDILEFFSEIVHLLGVRRKQKAEEALKYIQDNPKVQKDRKHVKSLTYETLSNEAKNRSVSLL